MGAEYEPPVDDRLLVCECGHIQGFHADGKGTNGTWCLALNCGCTDYEKERLSP